MVPLRLPASLLLAAGLATPVRAQTAITPGRWPVGFTTLTVRDSGSSRPFTAGVWYPARAGGVERLTYRRYLMVDGGDEEIGGLSGLLASRGAPPRAVAAWLDRPMLAMREAASSGERHPLVLIAQGNGQTLHDQAPLAEILASHGYLVATAPSPMRLTGPLTDERMVGARAAEQARDLELVAEALAGRADLAPGRIGIVGHSFGARAGLLLAMHEQRVAALVSIDGGIGTGAGRASLEAAPEFRADLLRTSVLHFYETLDNVMAPDFGLLRSLGHSDRWLVLAPAMHHHLFTSLGAAALENPELRPALGATAAAVASYAAVTSATIEFLDGFVAGNEQARARVADRTAWPGLDSMTVLPRGGESASGR